MTDSYNKPKQTSGSVSYTDLDISFLPHPLTGDLRVKSDSESIKQSIRNLLYIKFYEVPFQPLSGSGVYDFLFEPLDQITKIQAENSIRRTIENSEPRVNIISIDVDKSTDNELIINLSYKIVNAIDIQKFSFMLKRKR
jgi:phage baseplate assembly protein W